MSTQPTAAQIERWRRLGEAGGRINNAISDLAAELGATNPLDRLAILSGIVPALADRIHDTMSEALDDHSTWPEISAAVGEGGDRKASLRVRARYHARNGEPS